MFLFLMCMCLDANCVEFGSWVLRIMFEFRKKRVFFFLIGVSLCL